MPKARRPAPRRRPLPSALPAARLKPPHSADFPPAGPGDQERLLDRILAMPNIAHVVPRLQPELLYRTIQNCGLEDSGELLALATPTQLAELFDLDLWRSNQLGTEA